MQVLRTLSVTTALLAGALTTGCATYYNHQGSFTAENASGEVREFLVNWQTADYPDWALSSDRSTAISLTTQCSERVLRFVDGISTSETPSCGGDGKTIVWCGDPARDLTMQGTPVTGSNHLCGWITAPGGQPVSIAELGTQLELHIQCWPAETRIGSGDEQRNLDYLKASSVPYQLAVRKVERGSAADRQRRLDDKICKDAE